MDPYFSDANLVAILKHHQLVISRAKKIKIIVPRSPSNGPHGIKFFVDPSGRIDLKTPSDLVIAGSLDRRRANQRFPATVQQPRSMSVSTFSTPTAPATLQHKRLLPASVSSYCTLTRNKGQRLLPDESVIRSSSSSVFKVPTSTSRLSVSSLGPTVTCHSSGISTGSVSSQSSETRSEVASRKVRSRRDETKANSRPFERSRRGSFKGYPQWRSSSVKIRVRGCQSEEEGRRRPRPLSELMSIKGSHEDIEDVVDQFLDRKELEKASAMSSSTSCSSLASTDSDSNLRPIGAAVLPTGWHRHPHHNHQHHSLPMRRCQSVDEEDEDKEESKTLDWKKRCQRNLFGSEKDKEDDEVEDCWFLDGNFVSLQLNDDSVTHANDCDEITWLSRDSVAGSSLFDASSSHNKTTSRDSSRRLKFVPSSVLNSRILRRHTTYIKSMDNVMASLMTSHSLMTSLSEKFTDNSDDHASQKPPHVHSWHKRGPRKEDLNDNRKRQQVGKSKFYLKKG